MCCPSSFEAQRNRQHLGLYAPRKLTAIDESHIMLTSPAISSELAETSGTLYTHLLSAEVWSDVAFMENFLPKNHVSDMERWPSDSTMHENTGGQKKAAGAGLMSQYLKYLAVAEGSLFTEGLKIDFCRWSWEFSQN